jgi:hypothetical protein
VTERSTSLFVALIAAAAATGALLMGGAAIIGGHTFVDAATFVGAVSMCAVSLAHTRTIPLAIIVPGVLAVASLGGFVRVIATYGLERRILRSLPLQTMQEGTLGEIAATNGIRLYTTPATRPAAFCFGLLRPRVVFTSGLLRRLSRDEQVAAFWHEAQHVRVREPLRCLLARMAVSTFFWLPMLRDLLERYTLVRELDADRFATSRTSRPALAGALEEVVASPSLVGAIGFADFGSARVDRLLDPQSPLPSLFRRSRIALSLAAVAALSLAFTYPASVPVSKRVHQETMMMRVPVPSSSGMTWVLVPCNQ